MVFAGRHCLSSIWTVLFLSNFQPSRAPRGIGFLASHHLTVFHPIPMAVLSGHVFEWKFYHRAHHHPHCHCLHVAFSRSFVCCPSSIIPTTTYVSIPNAVKGSEPIISPFFATFSLTLYYSLNCLSPLKPHGKMTTFDLLFSGNTLENTLLTNNIYFSLK